MTELEKYQWWTGVVLISHILISGLCYYLGYFRGYIDGWKSTDKLWKEEYRRSHGMAVDEEGVNR